MCIQLHGPHPPVPSLRSALPSGGLGLSGAEVELLWGVPWAEPAPHGGACLSLELCGDVVGGHRGLLERCQLLGSRLLAHGSWCLALKGESGPRAARH